MKSVFLLPGDLVVENDPIELITILGSCVGIAMHDRKTKRTGLNHYLLPGPGDAKTPGRYGNTSIPELVARFLNHGCQVQNLVAKVYGGANVLAGAGITNKIGDLNIEIARALLQGYGIPILEEKVGGFKGRRIQVHSKDFRVVHGDMREGSAA